MYRGVLKCVRMCGTGYRRGKPHEMDINFSLNELLDAIEVNLIAYISVNALIICSLFSFEERNKRFPLTIGFSQPMDFRHCKRNF